MKPAALTVISFRLDPELARPLEQQARRLGVSPHELARHLVTEALTATEQLAALGAAVTALHQAMQGLRENLALSVEALLASAGEVEAREARAWVEANLNGS
jgi:predicted transcriptional regulator